VELRWKFARFQFINNNFYAGLNGFADFGTVTRKIAVNPQNITPAEKIAFFSNDAEKFHPSYGAGLRLAMNENFVIAVDYGRSIREQDGNSGLYIGLNYLF